MKQKWKTCLIILGLLILTNCKFQNDKRILADKLIEQAVKFNYEKGYYPYDIFDYEDKGVYYQLTEDSLGFEVWYGLGLGDSHLYKSKTKKWSKSQ